MELVFVIDISAGTINPSHFRKIITSLKTTYSAFVIGAQRTRVGVIVYDKAPHIVVELSQGVSQDLLGQKLDGISQGLNSGPSALGKALMTVQNNLFIGQTRPETPKLLVVITGEKANDDVNGPSHDLKDKNTTIFTVGVGDRTDKEALATIATFTAKEHALTTDISSHDSAGQNLASRIRKGINY